MHFTPALKMMAAAEKAHTFVKDNKNVLFEILKPLAPYIIVLLLLDTLVSVFLLPPKSETHFSLDSLLSGYFFAALTITWHRVVLHGVDNYTPMNPFRPKKNELIFIGLVLLFFLTGIVICAASMVLIGTMLDSAILRLISLLIGFFIALYLGFRLSFCFPARATNSPITFKKSFILTRFYVLKMIGSTFMASLGVVVFMIIYFLVGGFLFSTLVVNFTDIYPPLNDLALNGIIHILFFILALPYYLYFQPLLVVYGVTVISNYYQYALQNKQEAHISA